MTRLAPVPAPVDDPDAKEFKIDDVTITSRPLKFERAEDLLAEVTHFVVSVVEHAVGTMPTLLAGLTNIKADADVMKLLPALMPSIAHASSKLADGNALKRLAPLVMAATSATMPNKDGELENLHLAKASDRATLFDAHPDLYYATLFHAGRVTFGPFLRVAGLLGKLLPTKGE